MSSIYKHSKEDFNLKYNHLSHSKLNFTPFIKHIKPIRINVLLILIIQHHGMYNV